MRDRSEIEIDINNSKEDKLMLEVLLDIREQLNVMIKEIKHMEVIMK